MLAMVSRRKIVELIWWGKGSIETINNTKRVVHAPSKLTNRKE